MTVIRTEILVAHPGRHHALHLVAGCIKSGLSISYVTPLYHCGFGRFLSIFPGVIGQKASGYFHPDIPLEVVITPKSCQIKKLISLFNKDNYYENFFDEFVAKKIESGQYQAQMLVTLQDYMPMTVRAAKLQGCKIWSDQISNQSDETMLRIMRHETSLDNQSQFSHSEEANHAILSMSDVITYPSNYCFKAIDAYIPEKSRVMKIAYGASAERFSTPKITNPDVITVVVRANTVRKGGHLFIEALKQCSEIIEEICQPCAVKFVILGSLEDQLAKKLAMCHFPDGISIVHGNIPHEMMAKLYQPASLFIMPALSEGMSLACIEALHASLPLIITKHCGIDGFVSGEMGYMVDDNPQSLATALIAAFKNQHRWQNWSVNSKILADQLTWEAYELSIKKLASEILS